MPFLWWRLLSSGDLSQSTTPQVIISGLPAGTLLEARAAETTGIVPALIKRRKKKMKLGKVEFCHLLQIIALFLCLSGMNQAEPSRSRSKPYFQSGRTRTKRSWVWNQFFVLEEYMGTDPLYVGKVGDLTKLWKVQMPAFWSVYLV